MAKDDEFEAFSSPPCLMREHAADLVPPVRAAEFSPSDWSAVRRWRRSVRTTLLAQRQALGPRTAKLRGEQAKERLVAAVDLGAHAVLAIYWPTRGEIDVRDVAERHIAAGGIAALPVVTQKHSPLEFWRWEPGMKMRRGFWNIPVPASRDPVRPDALLIPLVGFDAAGFRLGYGGGYYDRTLAAMTPLPPRVGLGYVEAEIATIYPQAHDVPMTLIVTDADLHLPPPSGPGDALAAGSAGGAG